jgi:N-acetylneuraminic acid mutarotase
MFFIIRIVGYVLLFIVSLGFAQDSLWIKKSDIPTARWHLSSVVVNDKIYAIGGVNGYTSIEEYDPETNSWDIKESMPTGRAFIGKGVVEGKIYIIGGSILFGSALTAVEMYDPQTNEWTSKAGLPSGRHGVGSCAVDGRIYVIGGSISTTSSLTAVEMYDPLTDEWTVNLADMPTARWEPECVAVNGKIYAIGGFPSPSSGAGSDAVEMYDPQTNEWTIKASLPGPRGGGSVAALNGMIYYFGGSSSHGANTDDIWVYDPSLDEWKSPGELPFAWAMMGAAVVDSTFYLMSGSKIAWPHNDNFHGLYSYRPLNITTNIEENKLGNNYPEHIILQQNYPNPFNPSTTIEFILPKSEFVELKVYNILGKEVSTLISKNMNQGNHTYAFDRKNLASGIYYYQITAGDYREVKKMILLQ